MQKLMALFFLLCSLIALPALANKNTPLLGKQLYEAACQRCHAPHLAPAIQAPPAFKQQAWQPIMTRAQQQAKANPGLYPDKYTYLLQQIKIGKGLMHHGGLCHEASQALDCSDDAYKAAIDYMRGKEPSDIE